jgi:hypothetical protein
MFRNYDFKAVKYVFAKIEIPSGSFKIVRIRVQELIYNSMHCKVIKFEDISSIQEHIKLKADYQLLQVVASAQAHEVLTPMNCIIEITK